MLLAIDIGNTSVSFALFDSESQSDVPVFTSKISAQKNRSSDEYAVLIKNIIDLHLGRDYPINCAAVSSVVPSITNNVIKAAELLSSSKPCLIGPGIKTGFKININDPACLGADIVANTAAALNVCTPPFIIFDAGTANTITVVDKTCSLAGTIIMPGIRISASALHDNTELLDTVTMSDNNIPMIGKNTEESVRSGIVLGCSMMIDGFVRNIRESLVDKDSGDKLGLIATGGYAKLITDNCRNKFTVDNSLTLRGIASLFYKNIRK